MVLTQDGVSLVTSNLLEKNLRPSIPLGSAFRIFMSFNLLRVFLSFRCVLVAFLIFLDLLGMFLEFFLHFPSPWSPLGIF